MNIFLWHVHGSWTTAFVHGAHQYYVPRLPERGPWGMGRATTYPWPDSVHEVSPEEARRMKFDAIILQRPEELNGKAEEWLGKRPGAEVPTIYLEHNTPQGRIAEMRHPAADHADVTIVHVTHFNNLFWDNGKARTRVIEHGIVDPGYRYTGELPRAVVVINEPGRRGRVTGTDLLPVLGCDVPYDLFGMKANLVGGHDDLPQDALHTEMGRRRVYLHPIRWTSLGLSLLEAMHLGMPIVALATTEVAEAVPAECGVVSNRIEVLQDALKWLASDADASRMMGERARQTVLIRYGLERFLKDWDDVLSEVVS